MQTLHIFLKADYPYEFETWEIGMFDTTPEGRKIEPCLGVRCQNGPWVMAEVLERALANERKEGNDRSSDH